MVVVGFLVGGRLVVCEGVGWDREDEGQLRLSPLDIFIGVHFELWEGEAGSQAEQILCGEHSPSE